MKKLHFTIITLFVLFAAQAQTLDTITSKKLLGEWNLRKIAQAGNIADLKTGDVSVSDEFAAQKGQTKEALAAQFKQKMSSMYGTLVFLPGQKMRYQLATAKISEGTYVITLDNGRQYLTDEYSGSKMEVYFKEGLLYWDVLSNAGIVTMAWEKTADKQ